LANQITFTDDVINISSASNADGTVRWHVYERPHGNGTSIFVQRELSGVLQAEVRLLAEGARPEIFFDSGNSEWIFIYNLQENAFMVRYDENEVPIPLIPQTGDTAVDHYSSTLGQRSTATLGERADRQVINRGPQDADNKPPSPDSVSVAAGPSPGTNFRIRWLPHAGQQDVLIAGFNVYVKRSSDGGMQKVNGALVPYLGSLLQVHETVVPVVAGRYYVTQVNRKGTAAVLTSLEEGRKREPSDAIEGDGLSLGGAVEAFMHRFMGEGLVGTITFVQGGSVFANAPTDAYKDAHMGEGFDLVGDVVQGNIPLVVEFADDNYKDAHMGEGFDKGILLVGTSGVVIG
jgi:hypothetical protein